MIILYLLLFMLFCNYFHYSHEIINSEYSVVSTTQGPINNNPYVNLLEAKIKSLEFQIQILLKSKASNLSTFSKQISPRNCKKAQEQGYTNSDIYYIQPEFSPTAFPVLCDMKTDKGGWTYILNRFDGSLDFYVGWNSYKEGFGNLAGEFWLGLEKIHLLTGYEPNELRIELVDWDDKEVYAHYNTFSIGNENEGYMIKILEGNSGNAGNSFSNEAGMKFTTKDKDQDQWVEYNCANFSHAGWWYNNCKWAHLTGKYFKNSNTGQDYLKGIYWTDFHSNRYSMKQVRMMVRPRNYKRASLLPFNKFN